MGDGSGMPVTGADGALSGVPAEAALYLRDLIKGLEAEAGTARALADRSERLRHEDGRRLQLEVDTLREELTDTRTRCDQAEDRLQALQGRLDDREALAELIAAANAQRGRP